MLNIRNKMAARDFIVSTDKTELNAQVLLGKESMLNSEVMLRIIRKNKMRCKIRTLKLVPEKHIMDTNIEDTYVRETLPYMSFKDSTVLKSGISSDEEHFYGMMRFNDMDEYLDKIGNLLLTVKLVIKSADSSRPTITLNELDSSFKAYNVSYENHPGIAEELGIMQYDSVNNEYYKDLTVYAKQIVDGIRNHKGFAFISEPIMNICSSESHYGKPKLVIEYIDPNKFQTEDDIPAEINFLESYNLLAELDLKYPFPVLNAETVLSKEFMLSDVLFGEYTTLDAQVTIIPTVQEVGLASETLLSQEALLSETVLYMSTSLNSEVGYRPPDESELQSEVDVVFGSARPAIVNLGFPGKSELEAELKCYNNGFDNLDAEVKLRNLSGAILNGCVSLYTNTELDAVMKLMFVGVEKELSAELTFSRDKIPAKVRFSPSTLINAELTLNGSSRLDAETIIFSKLDLDAEMVLALVGSSDIESEVNIRHVSKLDAEVTYVLFESLDAEMMLYTNSNLDALVNVSLVGISDIESEVRFDISSKLDSELIVFSQDPLNSEMKLLFENAIDGEMIIYSTNNLDAEMMLYTNIDVDAEMVLHLLGMSSLESEINLEHSSILLSELKLYKPGETYLDACVNTYSKSGIFAVCNLGFPGETKLDSEVSISLYIETKLDSEVKLAFSTSLESVMMLQFRDEVELDAELIFLKEESTILPGLVNIALVGHGLVESECIFRTPLRGSINIYQD